MVKAEVEKVVLEALQEVQVLSGREWCQLPAGAAVIGTLDGFDSLAGIEATSLVEQKLAKKLGRDEPVLLKRSSIFVSDDGHKALSLGEVVATVYSAMAAAA